MAQREFGGRFQEPHKCAEFQEELIILQKDLRNYTRLLADIAGVEDLTDMESQSEE